MRELPFVSTLAAPFDWFLGLPVFWEIAFALFFFIGLYVVLRLFYRMLDSFTNLFH